MNRKFLEDIAGRARTVIDHSQEGGLLETLADAVEDLALHVAGFDPPYGALDDEGENTRPIGAPPPPTAKEKALEADRAAARAEVARLTSQAANLTRALADTNRERNLAVERLANERAAGEALEKRAKEDAVDAAHYRAECTRLLALVVAADSINAPEANTAKCAQVESLNEEIRLANRKVDELRAERDAARLDAETHRKACEEMGRRVQELGSLAAGFLDL